jgi:cytoskeletal protein CcmA (bactofilin family)
LFGGKRDGSPDEAPGPTRSAATVAQGHRTPTGGAGGYDVANIGKSISIKGDLTGNEDMVIEGKVDGKVELPNNQLTIGANGVVKAEVQAKSVVIVGRVAGNVHGTERVEIQGSGVVEGDVTSPKLIVSEGAVLNGNIHMSSKPAGAAATQPGAATARQTA